MLGNLKEISVVEFFIQTKASPRIFLREFSVILRVTNFQFIAEQLRFKLLGIQRSKGAFKFQAEVTGKLVKVEIFAIPTKV